MYTKSLRISTFIHMMRILTFSFPWILRIIINHNLSFTLDFWFYLATIWFLSYFITTSRRDIGHVKRLFNINFRGLTTFVMLMMGVVGKYSPSISLPAMYAYIRFNCIFVFPPLSYESRFPLSRSPKLKPEIRNSKRYVSSNDLALPFLLFEFFILRS